MFGPVVKEIEAATQTPMKKRMTRIEAMEMLPTAEASISTVGALTPKKRKRRLGQLKISTIIKLMCQERAKARAQRVGEE